MLQTVRKMSSIEWQELKNRIWPRFFVGPDVMVYLTCAVIGLGGRGVIKTWTEVAARVRLYMLTSDLTSLVPPQFSHWLQVRKVGKTSYFFPQFLFTDSF